ncbi:MAG: serine-type D-Ala-D-Ala carboxypeptidase [Pseudomonas sp.]|jgi:D-alanyl-D-alanine carboxypeptidase (penicillin-binding protein 5/6)|uniref:D-alanyl-D-alanine carboxypeptidase family protein n=1 Tax=Stutzerimonas xanthomarina TaxID=271420 RepID=UPI000C35201F|nr:D-alanyl-D-alanine carboxypeptidase family protein [Stutzerimonas xanthomarina]MAX92833.1 serine-type D-Ala-D-Ala carboxypeptidase [Pseudomonas sp.]MBU0811225.1 D-alanyl-D-alanine carboxypeptidase [Gammaproteobacteria bacterium]MBK3849083.1 serine-type D-Ala-D-Ala carboxypeptidase [Stutzerimonas xanthomarina]MBU0851237.1 D-alanyl-D-alanine carboxypeptidase [Gammaproteobacteria bacterium]MBU1303127.1 D-alanyl-D-alanine carboxypeptidase [Gammaproteobacteria bacterium]|tara:strand:+ start:68662 stop:69819 length:1158 start_codon:yes stop_codon:yes gene_type:complete
MTITTFVHRLFLLTVLAVAPTAWAEPIIPSPPQLAAKSYVLMDAASGKVLVENAGDERLPPASLTKLMTAYIATLEIKKGQISESDMVTVSEKAWRTGGSRMFIQVNTQVSVDDLLHGIIIQSGNDASVAMAEHIAGSEEAFADLMNSTAQRLGMSNTHFMNATGLPHPEHYSSAADMAKLARAIIHEDPAHYGIYAQKEFFWNNIKQPNRNLLLWRDKTVDGLKTGHTEEAGYCLVASAVRDDMRLITAVFGTNSEQARAAETQKLLTYGFRFFETRTFYQKGVELATSRVWKGQQDQVSAGLAGDLTMTLPRGQMDKLQAGLTFNPELTAPIQQGDVVGKVEVSLDGQVVQSTDLIALQTVEEGGLFSRLWDSIQLFFFNLFN